MSELLARLDVASRDGDRFVGQAGGGLPRVHGGEVAAQALVAAQRTVATDRIPHSIKCDYLPRR